MRGVPLDVLREAFAHVSRQCIIAFSRPSELLGVLVLAFFFRRVGANGTFFGVLAGEAAIFTANLFNNISFFATT
jgi:hypothetical protein